MPAPESTCWTIIHDAAMGDRTARTHFASVYLPIARAYFASRWGNRRGAPDPDEATQELFLECFRSNGLLSKAHESAGGFKGFLLGAARNIARRHETRARLSDPLPPALASDDTGPAEAFDRQWARTLVRQAIRVQRETARLSGPAAVLRAELLRMRFREGLPIREIATRWRVDPARLHHEYATAREEFRTALRGVVAFHLPGVTSGEIDRSCHDLLALLKGE